MSNPLLELAQALATNDARSLTRALSQCRAWLQAQPRCADGMVLNYARLPKMAREFPPDVGLMGVEKLARDEMVDIRALACFILGVETPRNHRCEQPRQKGARCGNPRGESISAIVG